MSTSHQDLRYLCPILFDSRWSARGLHRAIALLDAQALCTEYKALRENAPSRSQSGKAYFVGHAGYASTEKATNRLEEHSAIALVNLGRRWARPGGGWFRLVDYQVPLKARHADSGIGKIDILGVTDRGRLVVVELKVEAASGGRSDAPPAALMEGLRYAAVVEANIEAIANEAEHRFGLRVARTPPIVQILAPKKWWFRWIDLPPAGHWGKPFVNLAGAVTDATGVSVECIALDDVTPSLGSSGQAPRFDQTPTLYPVELGKNSPIGEELRLRRSDSGAGTRYLEAVNRALWSWADQHHKNQLDGGPRPGRSPVLSSKHADLNVLVPPDGSHANDVRKAIGPEQRHRYFASLRSSQALTQTVFGALSALGQLKLLESVMAECGRPAFFLDHQGWMLEFEHQVSSLGERRRTSVDVLMSGPVGRVAVECKFTETEFGTCSRPRLRPGDADYSEQHCDGNYRAQAGRDERCALTQIGVRYWDYLPQLFAWPNDRDHASCPFGPVYQLARNALAAVLSADGEMDLAKCHALVIYDSRNPAFQAGGDADKQWEAAVAACLHPGLLRRVTWQHVLRSFTQAPDLAWLVDAMGEKYGLTGN